MVHHVSKWPGQGAHKGYSKIPTLVYYNQDLKVLFVKDFCGLSPHVNQYFI